MSIARYQAGRVAVRGARRIVAGARYGMTIGAFAGFLTALFFVISGGLAALLSALSSWANDGMLFAIPALLITLLTVEMVRAQKRKVRYQDYLRRYRIPFAAVAFVTNLALLGISVAFGVTGGFVGAVLGAVLGPTPLARRVLSRGSVVGGGVGLSLMVLAGLVGFGWSWGLGFLFIFGVPLLAGSLLAGAAGQRYLYQFPYTRVLMEGQDVATTWNQQAEVLGWPRCNESGEFLCGAARLVAFRTEEEWLIVLERFGFDSTSFDFENRLMAYGDKVLPGQPDVAKIPQAVQDQMERWGVRVVSPWLGDDWSPSPLDFEVKVHGQIRAFQFTSDDYAAAGVDLTTTLTNLGAVQKILPMLCQMLSADTFFLPPELVLTAVGRPAWLHPYAVVRVWDDTALPMSDPTLRDLARAMTAFEEFVI